jgi:hypothetical protein
MELPQLHDSGEEEKQPIYPTTLEWLHGLLTESFAATPEDGGESSTRSAD